MGRANRQTDAIFYDEDLSAQVVVTLEPEADYAAVPLADAVAELSLRLSETKRDSSSGQPSKEGDLFLQKGKDVVFYSNKKASGKRAELCLSVSSGEEVLILLKAAEREKEEVIYSGFAIGDAISSLRSLSEFSEVSGAEVSASLAEMLDRYPA